MTFDGERESAGVHMPAREAEILGFAAKGLTDKQISAELGISRDTVSTYWRRILLRYNAANRTEVVARVVESEFSKKVNEAERVSAGLLQEIYERTEAQAKDLATRNLLVAVQSALVAFVSGAFEPEMIFQDLLTGLLSATGSEFGFIAELSLEKTGEPAIRSLAITNISWDEPSRARYDGELTKQFLPYNRENLIGAVITSRIPVIVNNPESDSRSMGVPDGHPAIRSYLGLPVFMGEEMVGIVAISNRAGGYSDDTVSDLTPLTATCSALIARLKADKAKMRAEREISEGFARLHALLNSLDSAVMFIDNNAVLRFANESFCRAFLPGMKPDEVMGMIGRELLNDFIDTFQDPKSYMGRVDEILSAANVVKDERITLKDGRGFLRNFYPLWKGDEYLGHVWSFRPAS